MEANAFSTQLNPAAFSRMGAIHAGIEKRLLEWLKKKWECKGMRISPSMIQTKARNLAKDEGVAFVASSGWYAKFRLRNQLRLVRLHGERSSADVLRARASWSMCSST